MAKEPIVFCWSGGKDSALALHRLLQGDRFEVVARLTTCNEHFQRVSMHGVRLELLEQQARAIGGLYPKTLVGLAECYVAATPFFRNTLSGDLLYTGLLFGGLALAENRFLGLRERPTAPSAV